MYCITMDLQSIKSNAWSVVADRRFVIVLCVTAVFICVALYVWRTYVSSRVNPTYVPNKEFIESEEIE